MAQLLEFWERSECLAFEWGQTDCALWAAQYVQAVTGHDPAASVRGTYTTAFQCRRVYMRFGGLQNACRKFMADYASGDSVAVVRFKGSPTKFVAVIERGFAWVMTERGLASTRDFEILEGWKICPKQSR